MFSFLAVAVSVKIRLNTNYLINTTFIAKPFYYRSILTQRRVYAKKLRPKLSCYSPFKLSASSKIKAKN
jgi:hypothetical protein